MEQFSYADNGISLQVNLTQGYQGIAQMLLQGYRQQVLNIKRSMRPSAAAIIDGAPPARIRSYAPRFSISAIIRQFIMQTLLNGETLAA